jgi:hypothetical protein
MPPQQPKKAVAVGEKPGVFTGRQLIARARQIGIDRFDNPGRSIAKHDDAVTEIDRFFEIVGDEDHGHVLFAA